MSFYKSYVISFADKDIHAVDFMSGIRKASYSLDLPLYSKFYVKLQSPLFYKEDVVIEIGIPEDSIFSIDYYEKKMDKFFYNKYSGFYDEHNVGNRLFDCYELCG